MLARLARLLRRPSPLAGCLRARLAGGSGLEIGGPSRIFSAKGRLPLYDVLARLDGVDHGARTVWTRGSAPPQAYRVPGRPQAGHRFVTEAGTLEGVPTARYDAVLASHVLEHLANPLRALEVWRRRLRPPGWLVLVVPHRDGTFDHRRPVTALAHLEQDRANDVGEDDLTHLEEILRLHDLARDPGAGARAAFEQRSRENALHRCLHHHVFDTARVVELLDAAAWTVEALDVLRPFHIAVLARGSDHDPSARSLWLARQAPWRRRSPFASDRSPVPGT